MSIVPVLSVKPLKGKMFGIVTETGVFFTGTLAQCYKVKEKVTSTKDSRLRRKYSRFIQSYEQDVNFNE